MHKYIKNKSYIRGSMKNANFVKRWLEENGAEKYSIYYYCSRNTFFYVRTDTGKVEDALLGSVIANILLGECDELKPDEKEREYGI